jgi:alginate O-acetyltransferase complex protein AlgI
MLFPTFTFALFFAVVFTAYWTLGNRSASRQNLILLVASYFFYGWWSPKFLGLLILVTTINFLLGQGISRSNTKKGKLSCLILGLIINIGVLIYFKYLNFFGAEFNQLLQFFGIQTNWFISTIIQPIGISFYLFLAISFLVDVFHKRIQTPINPISFALSLSFFPILLAGPVHRPAWLLPELKKPRYFSSSLALSGTRQVLWGLFMKLVIADHCAQHVNTIFTTPDAFGGSTLLLGVLLFSIQIYADFAGYSHMAIGISKLLGINIMQNFAYPYFASTIRQFWQRWNISLTQWFRDYLFLPIAYALSDRWKNPRVLGIQTEKMIYFIAAVVTWVLTGLWHGAGYTFLVWGLLHGVYLILFHFGMKTRKKIYKNLHLTPTQKRVKIMEGGITMLLVGFAWLFFRAENMADAGLILQKVTSSSLFAIPAFPGDSNLFNLLLVTILFFGIEWYGRNEPCPVDRIQASWPRIFRWGLYYALIILMLFFHPPPQPFVYFQF